MNSNKQTDLRRRTESWYVCKTWKNSAFGEIINLERRQIRRRGGHVKGLLQLRFEHDSSTIRARFEHDTSTTRYNTLRGFSCARIRDRFEHSTRISGRRVLHVDWQLNAVCTQFLLFTYIGLSYIVCVNMPEIVYTNAIKCQYAEYTIIHVEIIVMLKWKTCDHMTLRAFIA